MAEWLRSGLQIRAPRFDSGSGLQILVCRLRRIAGTESDLGLI